MMSAETWTVSIDAGGTFTDAVARSTLGSNVVAKVASTPRDPSRGLANAVLALHDQGMPLDAVTLVCHGTTVATNATLTGNLARIALVGTEGYRDLMGYRQSSRPQVYSLMPERPQELVERSSRFEVRERLTSTGAVLTELTNTEIDRVAEEVALHNPEAVAISLLFSYLNDDHEKRLADAIRLRLPHTPVTASSEIAREFREYPRTATTVINAALRPVIGGYLQRAQAALREIGVAAPFVVMQSNGGSVPAERAERQAHRLILSGPAGGVAGLVAAAEHHGLANVISLDMGGTSTDICVVRDGLMPFTTTQVISDHLVLAPTVDIHTIGAGGGSIAWSDASGRLRVGPQSAKADPGPACYGRGGLEPTITDAHVVLGTLGTGELAGELSLDRDAAREAVRRLAEPLDMTVVEAAEAILAIGLAHMVRAVRKVSVERGLDPREFSLVPFGGAGPLHAGLLLRHLGLRNVIVPQRPGLFSADGLLVAGLRADDSRTVLSLFEKGSVDRLVEWFDATQIAVCAQLVSDGVDAADVRVTVSADCRYLGQGFEIPVPLDGWDAFSVDSLGERFHAAHLELYGHSSPKELVEVVTLRVSATGGLPRAATEILEQSMDSDPTVARLGYAEVYLPGEGTSDVALYDRAQLRPGHHISGPAIIQQMDSTTVFVSGQNAIVADNGDLIITEVQR
ncbi:MAG: hydantoinase/oxoprolinase family protein [Microbacteriaceae bacterium]